MTEVAGRRDAGTPGHVPRQTSLPGARVPVSRRPGVPSLAKVVLFAASLAPLAVIALKLCRDEYGEPVRDIEHATGEWALRFLAITLALTPLRRLFGWNVLAKYRRMLGLFTFFYATVHLGIYLGLDMLFDVGDIVEDATKHPRIWIG